MTRIDELRELVERERRYWVLSEELDRAIPLLIDVAEAALRMVDGNISLQEVARREKTLIDALNVVLRPNVTGVEGEPPMR